MKIYRILYIVFVICCVWIQLAVMVNANGLIPLEGYTENTDGYPDNSLLETENFIQDDTQPFIQDETQPFIQDDTQDFIHEEMTMDETQLVRSVSDPVIVGALAPMTPSNTNGFQAIVLNLLGNYNPVVLEYAYTNSNGYVSYVREVQPDYSWMCSTAIFAIVLFCLFRMVGGLIKK